MSNNNKRFKASMPATSIARLKLEAIFHPKFENEATPDSDTRRKMLSNVSSGGGYLEASLKHSGSLLLWSGRQCFYSKNSTDNMFTHVGEIMLMQHFARCYSKENESDANADGSGSSSSSNWKEEYHRCSEYVYQNRLTCSFEVVTSILGHHGDLPKRDYLILIAVADREYSTKIGRGRAGASSSSVFYSTSEIVRFAHKFRLPHNDAWIFASVEACEELFHSYDTMREVGTATSVINRLDQVVSEHEHGNGEGGECGECVCAKVSSLYPHDVFQGEILEGIVIRYVPYDATSGASLDRMKELCEASNELLRLVPPSRTLDKQLKLKLDAPLPTTTIEKVDLRALAATDDFECQVENVLQDFHGPNIRKIQRWDENDTPDDGDGDTMQTAATKCINVANVAEEILSSSSTDNTNTSLYDKETLDIAQLIKTVDKLNIHASYKVLTEKTSVESEDSRCLCILQIHNDSSFPKYHNFLRQNKNGGMKLFRGFSIELVRTDDGDGNGNDDISNGNETEKMDLEASTAGMELADANEEEKLMLKMKFVPYMVRTFICRNGLSLLLKSSPAAFLNHASAQLLKWRVSDTCVREWMPFFKGWARYCALPPDESLPPLSENTYIYHYNAYAELFAKGEFQPSTTVESSFPGLIVIVGQSRIGLEALGASVSKELHCSRIVQDVNEITEKDVILSMSRSEGGLICIAEILDGYGNLRKLTKKHHDAIYVIMVEGESGLTLGIDELTSRKIKGMTQGWKKLKCNMVLDLPKEAAAQTDIDTALHYLRTDNVAKATVETLSRESSKKGHSDERPGLIVYFPSIPGSGKSSLCKDVAVDALGMGNSRPLVLMEGDRVKGKFYDAVQNEIMTKPASVAILDKNVPPRSFHSIRTLCIESKSIALAVIPADMEDTLVSDGDSSAVYPFSLQHLAVCMSRVLERKPKSHKGKLDSATTTACMVVVKFYCFYRHLTAAVLKEKVLNVGHHAKHITVPFFKEFESPDLPTELKTVLEDAVILQTREDMKLSKVGDKGMIEMDNRLRSAIQDHQNYIDNLTVSLAESKKAFVSELSRVIDAMPDKMESLNTAEDPAAGTIKIASLDLNYEDVHAEIEKFRKSHSELDQYFAEREEHRNNDENDKSQSRFIKSVHCTFAHASQFTQATMLSTFQHLLGTSIDVKATSMLFSDELVAVELEIPSEASVPRPQNDFTHITIWCAKDVEACKSNELPEKVKRNEAKRVAFEQPIIMKGVFSFWYY